MSTYESRLTSRPDWVVLGTPWRDGQVAILASTDLTHGELVAEQDDVRWRDLLVHADMRYEVRVGLRSYQVIVADTYSECWEAFTRAWSPKPAAPRPALDPAS